MDFERMWAELAPVGRTSGGGYRRSPFGSAERECAAWYAEECGRRGLELEYDGNANAIAWWRPEGATGPGIVTGSHLDSVIDGGAYDGPLGVVSALAAIDLMRERGLTPAQPVGVATFVEEEGSRFGMACLGSRLAVGAIDPGAAAGLRDRGGVTVPDAMAAAGLEPVLGPSPLLEGIGTFVELHVEQGRCLVDRGAAVGVASRIWPHGRYRFEFTGTPDHAGTTRMEDRHDPMLTYAMTALAANKQARLAGQRATFGRVEVAPNATNAIPARITAWLDARCEDDETLARLLTEITRQAQQRGERDGTGVDVAAESVSAAADFDPDLAERLSAVLGHAPVIATQAGHDAGILAAAGIPTAMLFVRNPTGVSHSPAEHAEIVDCLAGVEALAGVLTELAR